MVEPVGIEPTTSCLQSRRTPNCAMAPWGYGENKVFGCRLQARSNPNDRCSAARVLMTRERLPCPMPFVNVFDGISVCEQASEETVAITPQKPRRRRESGATDGTRTRASAMGAQRTTSVLRSQWYSGPGSNRRQHRYERRVLPLNYPSKTGDGKEIGGRCGDPGGNRTPDISHVRAAFYHWTTGPYLRTMVVPAGFEPATTPL